MRVLWPHNFNPAILNSGVFMYHAERALVDFGVRPKLLQLGNLRSPGGMLKARALVRESARGFDIVHSQYGSASALVSASVKGPELAVSIRGSDWNIAYQRNPLWRLHARSAVAMTRLALPRYDRAFVVSNRMGREVHARFPTLGLSVLPSPIDTELFFARDRAESCRRLGLDPHAKYVLFTSISRTNPLKRIDLAEAAVEVARESDSRVRILVGNGYPNQQMPQVVSCADAIICTSTSEGWPNSVKEALACNVPFVATDVGDLAEIAEVDPRCRIAQPDPQSLAEALLDVLSQPRGTDLDKHIQSMTMEKFAIRLISDYETMLRST